MLPDSSGGGRPISPSGRMPRAGGKRSKSKGWRGKLFCNAIQSDRKKTGRLDWLVSRILGLRGKPAARFASCLPNPSSMFRSPPASLRFRRYVKRSKFCIKEQRINDITRSLRHLSLRYTAPRTGAISAPYVMGICCGIITVFEWPRRRRPSCSPPTQRLRMSRSGGLDRLSSLRSGRHDETVVRPER